MGVVIHIVFCLVRHLQNKRDEKSYRERHAVKIENVNKEKLKALLIDCEKNGIDPRKRLCDCRCPYSEAKPSSESCCDEKGNDTDDPKNALLFLVADRIVLYSILMLNMFPAAVGMNRMNQNLILVNVCVGCQNVRKTKN
jgi:hypothetical protein